MLALLFSAVQAGKIRHIITFKASSKTGMVTMCGSSHLLAVGEVSDSLSAYPPRLTVYTIGSSRIVHSQQITGPSASLGRALSSIGYGFLASSPQAALSWGNPGPLITKINPPKVLTQKLDTNYIPYGETLGSSLGGKVYIACAPVDSKKCFVKRENQTSSYIEDDEVVLFGVNVAVTPDGAFIAVLSQSQTGYAKFTIYDSSNTVSASFQIPVKQDISLKKKNSFIKFQDNKRIIISLFDDGKMLHYRYTVNGWIQDPSQDISIISIDVFHNEFVTLTQDGVVKIHDSNFNVVAEEIISKSIAGSKFVKIVSGNKWFAVLEESPNKRMIHLYTLTSRGYAKGFIVLVAATIFAVIYIIIRPKFSQTRSIARSRSRPYMKQV